MKSCATASGPSRSPIVHLDVKTLGRIPPGGGHRCEVASRHAQAKNESGGVGYAYIHSAIDAHSRLAYSEVHSDERSVTNLAFWRGAKAFFASYGATIQRVLSDNGSCYRAKEFAYILS